MASAIFPSRSFNYVETTPGSSFGPSGSLSYVTIHSTGSLTTKGYPVIVGLKGGYINGISVANEVEIAIRLTINGVTVIGEPMILGIELDGGSTMAEVKFPGSMHALIPVLAAGTYTFEVQAKLNVGTSFGQTNLIMFAYELYHF